MQLVWKSCNLSYWNAILYYKAS